MRVSSQRKGNHRVLGWRCLPLTSKKETDNLDGQSLIITGAYPVWGKEDSTGLTRTYVQQVTLDYFRKKEVGMRCTLLEGRLEKHKGATEILADQTWNRWDPGYFWGSWSQKLRCSLTWMLSPVWTLTVSPIQEPKSWEREYDGASRSPIRRSLSLLA